MGFKEYNPEMEDYLKSSSNDSGFKEYNPEMEDYLGIEEEPEEEKSLLDKAIDYIKPDKAEVDESQIVQAEDTTTTMTLPEVEKSNEQLQENKDIITGTGKDYESPTAPDGNLVAKYVNRSNKVIANSARMYQAIIDEATDGDNTGMVGKLGEWIDKDKLPEKDVHTPDEVKKAFKAGGVFDIDSWQEAGNYIVETGAQSIGDMQVMIANAPTWIAGFGYETAEERAKNDGREKPNKSDLAIGTATAIAEYLMEMFGLKGVTKDVISDISKEVLRSGVKDTAKKILKATGKGTLKESGTEGLQEGVLEPTGERIGTKSDKPLIDAERGGWGALAGGGTATTVSTATGIATEALKPKTKEDYIAQELEREIDSREYIQDKTAPLQYTGARNRGDLINIDKVIHPEIRKEVEQELPNATSEEVEEIAIKVQDELGVTPEEVEKAFPDETPPTLAEAEEKAKKKKGKAPKHIDEQLGWIEDAYSHEPEEKAKAIKNLFKGDKLPDEKFIKSLTKEDIETLDNEFIKEKEPEINRYEELMDKFFDGKITDDEQVELDNLTDTVGLNFEQYKKTLQEIKKNEQEIGKSSEETQQVQADETETATEQQEVSEPKQSVEEIEKARIEELSAIPEDELSVEEQWELEDLQEKHDVGEIKTKKYTIKDAPHIDKSLILDEAIQDMDIEWVKLLEDRTDGKVRAGTILVKFKDDGGLDKFDVKLKEDTTATLEDKSKYEQKGIEDGKKLDPRSADAIKVSIENNVGKKEAQEYIDAYNKVQDEKLKEYEKKKKEKQKEDTATPEPKPVIEKPRVGEPEPEAKTTQKKKNNLKRDSLSNFKKVHKFKPLPDELEKLKNNKEKGKNSKGETIYDGKNEYIIRDSTVYINLNKDENTKAEDFIVSKEEATPQEPEQEKLTPTETLNNFKTTTEDKAVPAKEGNTELLTTVDELENEKPPKDKMEKMPNNPPLFGMNDIENSEGYNYLKVDREKGTFEIDGKPMQYPTDKAPISFMFIKDKIQDIIGYDPYYSNIYEKDVGGHFNSTTNEIRRREYNDLEYVLHEVAGHFLDNNSYVDSLKNNKKAMAEVREFSYTKDKNLIDSEGFAEFARAYFTNPNFAKEKAPKAYEIMDFIARKDKRLKSLQHYSTAYFAQTSLARFRSNMQSYAYDDKLAYKTNNKFSLAGKFDSSHFIIEYLDRTHGMEQVEYLLNNGEGLFIEENSPTKQYRLALGHAGSTYESVVLHGVPMLSKDGNGLEYRKDVKGLQEVFKTAIKNDTMKEWTEFALAINVLQETGKGKKTPIETGTAKTIIREYSKKYPYFKQITEEYNKFNDAMLDWYVEMQYITPQTKAFFKEANKFYLPTQRVIESQMHDRTGGGSRQIQKRAKAGSVRAYNDIIENITSTLHGHIQGALVSYAKSKLFEKISKSKEGSKVAVKFDRGMPSTDAGLQTQITKTKEFLAEHKLILGYIDGKAELGDKVYFERAITDGKEVNFEDIGQMIKEDPTILHFFNFGYTPHQTTDSVIMSVIIDGKVQNFEIKKSNHYGQLLLKSFDAEGSIRVSGLLKVGSTAKNFITKAITLAPAFKLRNFTRDTMETLVYRRGEMGSSLAPQNAIKGAKEFLKQGDNYKLYMLNGGGYGSFVEAYTDDNYISMLLGDTEGKFWRYYSADEYANRMAVFLEAKKSGKGLFQATSYGSDITLDFTMRGANETLQTFYKIAPFLQAQTNGYYKLYREAIRKGKSKKEIMFQLAKMGGRGAMYMTVMSLMAYLLNTSDDDRKELLQKQNSYTRSTKLTFLLSKNPDDAIVIDLPYTWGFLLAKIPEFALSYGFGDEMAKGTTAQAFKYGMKFNFLPEIGGGIFQPLMEHFRNENFAGIKIEPEYMKKLLPTARYDDTTREYAKDISSLTGWSPKIIEHYIKSYFGYLERFVGDMTDVMLRDGKYGASKDTMFDVLIKSLYINVDKAGYETASNSYGQMYREIVEELRQVHSTFTYSKNITKYDMGELVKEIVNRKDFTVAEQIAAIDKAQRKELQAIREQKKFIDKNKTLSSKQKKEKIKALNKRYIGIQKKYLHDVLIIMGEVKKR